MKKRILPLLLALLVLLAGCGGQEIIDAAEQIINAAAQTDAPQETGAPQETAAPAAVPDARTVPGAGVCAAPFPGRSGKSPAVPVTLRPCARPGAFPAHSAGFSRFPQGGSPWRVSQFLFHFIRCLRFLLALCAPGFLFF